MLLEVFAILSKEDSFNDLVKHLPVEKIIND